MRRAICMVALGLMAAGRASADDKGLQKELAALKGSWRVIRFEEKGKAVPKEKLDRIQLTLTFMDGGKATLGGRHEDGGPPAEFSVSIDPSKAPKTIDFTNLKRGRKQLGIYKLEKGRLTICLRNMTDGTGGSRPTEFTAGDDLLIELRRPEKK